MQYLYYHQQEKIDEARKWYNQYSDELPVRFKEELKLIIEALKFHPGVHA